MNNAASTYTSQLTLRNSPRATFRITYAVKPNARPLAMLNVKGIVTIVKNAGTETTGSDHGISAECAIMSEPMTISAGAVAAPGIAPTAGAIKSATQNSNPVVIAVTPVR